MTEERKLKGSDVFIAGDFSSKVREVRSKRMPHLKAVKSRRREQPWLLTIDWLRGRTLVLGKKDKFEEVAEESVRPDIDKNVSNCVLNLLRRVKNENVTPATHTARASRDKTVSVVKKNVVDSGTGNHERCRWQCLIVHNRYVYCWVKSRRRSEIPALFPIYSGSRVSSQTLDEVHIYRLQPKIRNKRWIFSYIFDFDCFESASQIANGEWSRWSAAR